MLKNVTLQETDTFDEVNKVLNTLIDNLNLVETKLCQRVAANDDYNAKVDKYNKSLDKPKKKSAKKKPKKKGMATVKTLIGLVVLLLFAATAFGEFQYIDFANVSNDNTLTLILRERLGRTGDTFTFPNGLTIDNATNNALTFTENSEDLILTFSSNTVTLSSSTTVTTFDFGTVDPTCDQLTLENAAILSNVTNGDVEITEGGEDLILRFSSNNVEFVSSTGVLGVDFNDLYIIFAEISAPSNNPANGLGWLYVKDNSGTTDLYFEDDAGGVTELTASASGVANLDEAYDGGGSGAGKAVTVDQGAIALTATDAADNTVLSLVQQDTSAASTLVITGSQATANAISIDVDAQTTGRDFEGTGASFYVEGDGTAVAVDVDITGAGGLILANDETITNNTTTEIAFTDSASSEDIIIDLDAGTNAVGWKSGSGVDEWMFGDVDDLTGISTVVFDATSVSITHTPDAGAEDFTIQQNGTTQNTSIVITTAGTPADALQLTASAGGIDISATSSDAGDDIDITATGTSVNITATENVADSIVISSSNAGIDITAAGAAAGEDIDITATGSSINVIATENQADAIVIDASDAAGGIDMDCGTGSLDIDVAGGITIDNTGASADIRVDSSAGSLILIGAEAAATAVVIDAENAAGGIDMDFGTGGMILTGTGSAANLTIDVDALSFDFTDSSNITVTSSEAGEDLTISQIGSNDSSIIITSAGQGANAIELTTSDAVGDIDINAGDAITIDAGDIVITTDDTAQQFHVNATGTVTGDAIILETSSGAIKLLADGSGTGDITLDAEGLVSIVSAEAAANQFKVDAKGAVAGNAIVFETTAGGLQINVDGTDGDIDIDADDAMTVDVNNITITTVKDVANAIYLRANAGTSETIKIHADQGTGVTSIELDSDDGGVTVNAAAANGAGLLTLNTLISIGAAGTLADNATPDVSTTSFWETGAATTYTDFDVGTGTVAEGTIIIIKSLHAAVFDVTSTELEGGTTDITTATGDLTGWIYDGTSKWRLMFRMDMSDSAD